MMLTKDEEIVELLKLNKSWLEIQRLLHVSPGRISKNVALHPELKRSATLTSDEAIQIYNYLNASQRRGSKWEKIKEKLLLM